MHINREIRKKLETIGLPAYVLEYLNEKFIEAEKYCEENKMLKQELQMLKEQMGSKDSSLMEMYKGNQQREPMGFYQPIRGRRFESPMRYEHITWEDEEYPETFEEPMDRRGRGGSRNEISNRRGGGRGSRNEARSEARNEVTSRRGGNQSRGGGSGGGSSNVSPTSERTNYEMMRQDGDEVFYPEVPEVFE